MARRRPLHLELLKFLREQEIAGATVLHAMAGFTGRGRVKTASLVDAGGKLPWFLLSSTRQSTLTVFCPK